MPVLSGAEPPPPDGSDDIGARQPLLLSRPAVDHVVEPATAATVLANRSQVAAPDHDAPRVVGGSVELLQRIHRDQVEEVV
ncbi:hypothetical protein ABT324_23105 [Saccharopolyspora sp. NPDC000359]|uniref:hypothetical protein n=1 Tax=Saccharopolyspora sp. NPDC000359 TaxID=3154251 RepID=UPI00331F13AD